MNIFCTGNIKKKKLFHILRGVIDAAIDFKYTLYFDEKINFNLADKSFKKEYSSLYNNQFIDFDHALIDLVICIGGDGSLISIIRRMGENQVPVLGIHIGNLGFLNQANVNNYEAILNDVFSSIDFEYSSYNLINAYVDNTNNETENFNLIALNDIVIKHSDLLRLITMDISIDKEYLNRYASDGMIFSTPLGSTAYSLSAGGPIVLHEINSIIITPISAHSLSARPIIIDGDKEVKITFPIHNNRINIVSDGQVQMDINSNSIVMIKKSNIVAKLIKTDTMESYYSKLKSKIGWFGSNHK